MAESTDTRVAVYIDFDNIVISQYDKVHGRGSFMKEKARSATGKTVERLDAATVNLGAVLDFASSFGTIAISRAYADWSAPVNARYKQQLVGRAVDLVQLFNTSGTKNGADIRLAIDVVEDLFRLPDITHLVIVAGDSDYIPLAQSAKRLGRTVIGIGVDGSTSSAFSGAVDDFTFYHDIPDLQLEQEAEPEKPEAPADIPAATAPNATEAPTVDPQRGARRLLNKALRARSGDDVDGWVMASALKQQMKRLDASFDEKTLGYKSFTDFVKANGSIAEIHEDGQIHRVRSRSR
jgi:uncharacterized LabA/DUF88 family protein